MIGPDRNADYNAVASHVADPSTPDRYILVLGGGPEHGVVACPICTAATTLHESRRGPEGRCPECTVIVRLDGRGKPRACGWRGGDFVKGGAALKALGLPPIPVTPRKPAKKKAKKKEPEGVVRGKTLRPCGSDAAWQRHMRAGETPCDACDAEHRRQLAIRGRRRRQRVRAERAARQEVAA